MSPFVASTSSSNAAFSAATPSCLQMYSSRFTTALLPFTPLTTPTPAAA